MSRRVKVQSVSGDTVLGTKLLSLPETTEEFFDLVRQRFGIGPTEPLQMRVDDADVDDIDIIRDDDTVVVCRAGDVAARRPNSLFPSSMAALTLYPPSNFPNAGMFSDSFGGLAPYGDPNSGRFDFKHRLVPKRRRYRRTHKELIRDHKCTVEGCGRLYASENSLVQHIRIKHTGYATEVGRRGRKSLTTVPLAHESHGHPPEAGHFLANGTGQSMEDTPGTIKPEPQDVDLGEKHRPIAASYAQQGQPYLEAIQSPETVIASPNQQRRMVAS